MLNAVTARPRLAAVGARPAQLTAKRTGLARPHVAAAAGKLISASEIPAFLPRDDFMDQLQRWAFSEVEANGVQNYGLPMKVEMETKGGEGEDAECPWGFTVNIQRDGNVVTSIRVRLDDNIIQKHEYIGMNHSNGMPVAEGPATDVPGKSLEIWKIDDNTIDDEIRNSIRGVCTNLNSAINKYYSFGSVFSEEF